MIIVASPSKPFQFTAKAQPRRKIIMEEYRDEIEALYKEVEKSSRSEFAAPAIWDAANTLCFVRAVVHSTLHRELADDADIFRNGGDRSVSVSVDALRAAHMRGQLASHLDTQHDPPCYSRD